MKKRDYVDSIIVTLPKKFFVEYSHEKYLEEIKHMTENPGEMIVMAPKNEDWSYKGFQGFRYIDSEKYF